MKYFMAGLVLGLFFISGIHAEELNFEKYLSNYDYNSRKEMKIDSKTLLKKFKEERILLLDIRFKEEFEAWQVGFARHIPLSELPKRLKELPKDKIIVTSCPHKDRAIIAMAYLRTKGYQSKYLSDGLIGLAEELRGDTAKKFITELDQSKNGR